MTQKTSPANRQKLKQRGVSLAVSSAVLLGTMGAMALPSHAAPVNEPADSKTVAPAPAAALESDDFKKIFTALTSSEQNLTASGELGVTEGVVIVNGKLNVPAEAKAGDSIRLTLSENFVFRTFQGLEIRDADKTLIATATATSSRLTITFADAVENLENVSGDFNFTVRGVHLFEQVNTGTLNLIAPDGTKLGPNSDHKMQAQAPNRNGMLLGTEIAKGNEIAIVGMPQYSPRDKNKGQIDPKTVKFTVETQERDAVVSNDYNWRYRFIDADGILMSTGDDGISPTGSANHKKINNNRVELTLPANTKVPAGAVGVRLYAQFVVGKASSDYHMAYKLEAMGDTPIDTFNNLPANTDPERDNVYRSLIKSAKLDGVAEGVLRPSRTTLDKKVTSDPSRILVGDVVTYTITTKNEEAGRAALGIVTTDTLPKDVEFVSATGKPSVEGRKITWPAVDIAGGEKVVRTVKVKVLSETADLFKNIVTNKGENTCFDGDGNSVCTDDAEAKVSRPGIKLDKKVAEVQDTNKNDFLGDAGDTILYGFTITNTGNTTEKSAVLTDELLGLQGYECLIEPLTAGAVIDCVENENGDFSYIISEEDGKAGSVHNVATITIPNAEDEDGIVEEAFDPDFEFTKSVKEVQDTNANGVVGDEGDTISWGLEVKNTGNATLESVLVTDALLGVEDEECLAEPLVPAAEGEESSVACEGEFTKVITAEDAKDGKVVNVATATSPGVDPKESSTETPTVLPPEKPVVEETPAPEEPVVEETPAPEKPAEPETEDVKINSGLGAGQGNPAGLFVGGGILLAAFGGFGGFGAWWAKRRKAAQANDQL